MTLQPGTAALARGVMAVIAALVAALWGWSRLRSTPEPAHPPGDGVWVKPTYREVANGRLLALSMVLAAPLAALASATLIHARSSPMCIPVVAAWAVCAGLGTVAVLCDLRTTYLPSSLLRPWAALTVASLVAVVALGAASDADRAGALVVRLVACVALARLVFWLWWRIGDGLGFGDVRLASILAADAATVSVSTWRTWLVVGTLLGAGWAVTVALMRRRRPSPLGSAFPYGPALAIGAWVALAMG